MKKAGTVACGLSGKALNRAAAVSVISLRMFQKLFTGNKRIKFSLWPVT